jgi:hypothetical protein
MYANVIRRAPHYVINGVNHVQDGSQHVGKDAMDPWNQRCVAP